ncbi:MAG: hypothetical protein JJE21_01075 [Spirochaetaceae bacterium]|nr:hypothetical protein [Spirochaetaceae bacterium]
MTKKVVIIITEGISDEYFLKSFLDSRYETKKIKFKVYDGDAFANREISEEPIRNIIGNFILQIMNTEKFKPSDILAVLQLTDTDGCMIDNANIIIKVKQVPKTFYSLDNIIVNSLHQKNNIISRNQIKKRKTEKMVKLKKVCRYSYFYQIYYFSRNIELVFLNDLNPIKEDKSKNALRFSKKNKEQYPEIIKDNTPPLVSKTYEERYSESWSFIKEGVNSLHQYSTFALLLEYLDSLI